MVRIKKCLGFVTGFGAKVGAVGATINLDENTLMIVGMNDEDMALCANILIDCGGEMAVVNRGEILEKAFPYGGLFCVLPRGKKYATGFGESSSV